MCGGSSAGKSTEQSEEEGSSPSRRIFSITRKDEKMTAELTDSDRFLLNALRDELIRSRNDHMKGELPPWNRIVETTHYIEALAHVLE